MTETPHEVFCSIWRKIRGPFRIPATCHRCKDRDWDVFDVDKAGCLKCGRIHACADGKCRAISVLSHSVCPITGFVTKTQNFQQQYVDGMVSLQSAEPHRRRWVTLDQVEFWFEHLTRSEKWKGCMEKELNRIHDKLSNMFFKIAKQWKIEQNITPNVVDLFTQVKIRLGFLRIPLINMDENLYCKLTKLCVLHVMQFAATFRSRLVKLVPVAKLHSLIVGLIYMLRHGLVVLGSLTILPSFPELKRLLPIETCLKTFFHIPCKIITETENMVKTMLKKINENELRMMIEQNYDKNLAIVM
jgi:hypothetical protein